jgi:hypothetical protein
MTPAKVTISKVKFECRAVERRSGTNVEGINIARGTIPGFARMDREA